VNDFDALRDYLKKQTRPEFVLRFDEIEEIIDAALPRAAQRASWWETLRSPQENAATRGLPRRRLHRHAARRRQQRAVQKDEVRDCCRLPGSRTD
jgi:hypothetical protein